MSTLIVLAASTQDYLDWSQAQPCMPRGVVVVTPRSVNRALGLTVEGILATPAAREHPRFGLMVEMSMPATTARGRS